MNIFVNAYGCNFSGALTIYQQFLKYLPEHVCGNKWHVLINSTMDHPDLGESVTYLFDDNLSWFHQINLLYRGIPKMLVCDGFNADVVVSFGNLAINTKLPQLVYFHQSIPLYSRKWNPFKKNESRFFMYKHIYPFFIKNNINKDTHFVVQIPFIKKRFVEKFGVDPGNVHVLFPDFRAIDASEVRKFDLKKEYINLLYPATPVLFKEHSTLVNAVSVLKEKDTNSYKKIRIWLTFKKEDFQALYTQIVSLNIVDCFVFAGNIPYQKLLTLYNSCQGLLYPSTLESLGLPLLEAASFGLPIIASKMEYAIEVIGDYKGVTFINPYDYDAWACEIDKLVKTTPHYDPYSISKESSWLKFYSIIFGIGENNRKNKN